MNQPNGKAHQSLDPDEVAQQMFGANYAHLSAWGRATVDHTIGKMYGLDRPKVNAPHNQTLPNVQGSLLADNERLARIVEDLQQENAELWEENQELRVQLTDIEESE
jgi:hypothetical protein